MSGRVFCIPGIIFLISALVLLIIVSISLPTFSAMDFARTHIQGSIKSSISDGIKEIRLGIWFANAVSYLCDDILKILLPLGHTATTPWTGRGLVAQVSMYQLTPVTPFVQFLNLDHGYAFLLGSPTTGQSVTIGSSWTRGLAIHPVAAAVTFIALLFSFSQHVTLTLVSSLLSFLAAFLTLIAFACDIALFAYLKHKIGDLDGVNADTDTGPAFWLTFVSFFLLLLAGCTVCFGRRRARMDGASSSYPMTSSNKPFWRRFRRSGY